MGKLKRIRRLVLVLTVTAITGFFVTKNPASFEKVSQEAGRLKDGAVVMAELESLAVKGRAPKTGYERSKFYGAWPIVDGCNLRQKIIKREFGEKAVMNGCDVVGGEYVEPYNGDLRKFNSKSEISKGIQIDHVVALSDAWQKGAQELSVERRYELATDPLNLIAADGPANMQKGDGDAATWLPKNKEFRCEYVERQIKIKKKYDLWVTEAEKNAMRQVLEKCLVK